MRHDRGRRRQQSLSLRVTLSLPAAPQRPSPSGLADERAVCASPASGRAPSALPVTLVIPCPASTRKERKLTRNTKRRKPRISHSPPQTPLFHFRVAFLLAHQMPDMFVSDPRAPRSPCPRPPRRSAPSVADRPRRSRPVLGPGPSGRRPWPPLPDRPPRRTVFALCGRARSTRSAAARSLPIFLPVMARRHSP